jgi:acyl-coenzyme A thioesterase PaaI-like protein
MAGVTPADERTGPSIQDRLYPDVACFGCGPVNERGLRLRSFPDASGEIVAEFTPWPEHDNGTGFLNGGIIATVLDCHSAAVVNQAADERGWAGEDGALLPYLTAGIDVRYRRPSPLHETVSLRGRLVAGSEAEMTAAVELWWEGKVRAEATAVWKRWRPRT